MDFEGTGQIACLDLTGQEVATGTSVFSGTLPKFARTGLTGGYIYRATVTWDDGTTTIGGCGAPDDEAEKVQAGVVLYVPSTL